MNPDVKDRIATNGEGLVRSKNLVEKKIEEEILWNFDDLI